jgi:hypothetical protein
MSHDVLISDFKGSNCTSKNKHRSLPKIVRKVRRVAITNAKPAKARERFSKPDLGKEASPNTRKRSLFFAKDV